MGRPRKNQASSSAYVPKKVYSLEGLTDITADTDALWSVVLNRLARFGRVYGFEKVETPLLEDFRLYENFYKSSPRELSKVVRVEVAGKSAAVRADLLPSMLRPYYQQKVYDKSPVSKWVGAGFVVLQDEKQNLVSDYRFGFEVFGGFNHLTEAQIIGGVWEFLQSLGLKDCSLEINHIGQADCQETYSQALRDFLAGKKYQLCDICVEHLDGRVLSIFRCDNLDCQALLSEAPTVLDFLDEVDKKHFTSILEALDELRIPYQLNPFYAGAEGSGKPNLVIKCKNKGETVIIGEGAYHDGLIQALSGKSFSCFGFSGSLSAVRNLLEANKITTTKEQHSEVFLVPLGELAAKKALRLFKDLTSEKISVYDHFGQSGVKNQLKQAESQHAPVALIMGQKEAADEMVILRDVKSGMQEIISYDKIVAEVKKRLGR